MDDFSRYSYIFLIASKSSIVDVFTPYNTEIENLFLEKKYSWWDLNMAVCIIGDIMKEIDSWTFCNYL